MLGVQSPENGPRGIGRYSQQLVSALLARDDDHEYFLYAHADRPTSRIPSGGRAHLRSLGVASAADGPGAAQRVDQLARENPDGLDALVMLSPFELWSGYCPPAQP